jgi:MFS family permease
VDSPVECAGLPSIENPGFVSRLRSKWAFGTLSRPFWTFFIAAFFFDCGVSLYFFLFNLFLLSLRFNERAMGIIAGALMIGNVVGTVPVGILARRIGLQKLLLFCFIAAPTIFICRTAFLWMPAQIGLAFLAGAALSIWPVCFSPTVASLTTESNRVFAFSIVFATGIGTGSIAGLAGGSIPQLTLHIHGVNSASDGMRLVLIGACVVWMLGIWPVAILKLRAPAKAERQNRPIFHPFLIRFLPPFAIWSIVSGSFIPFAPVFFQKQLHMSLQHVGVLFSTSQLAQFCAVLITPLLYRKAGSVVGIICAQVVAGGALVALGFSHTASLAVAWYLFYTAVQFSATPGFYGLLMSSVPEMDRSGASAVQNIVGALAGASSAALTGSLVVRYGYGLIFNLNAVLAGVAALLLFACYGYLSSSPSIELPH